MAVIDSFLELDNKHSMFFDGDGVKAFKSTNVIDLGAGQIDKWGSGLIRYPGEVNPGDIKLTIVSHATQSEVIVGQINFALKGGTTLSSYELSPIGGGTVLTYITLGVRDWNKFGKIWEDTLTITTKQYIWVSYAYLFNKDFTHVFSSWLSLDSETIDGVPLD